MLAAATIVCMNTTENPTQERPLLDELELAALNRARRVLVELEKRATRLGYIDADGDTRNTTRFYAGKAAERCEVAEHEIFQVLNCLSSYGLQKLSEHELHNKQPEPAA